MLDVSNHTNEGAPPSRRPASQAHEAALLARVAAGDMAAFEALYRLYHPRLTRFVGLMSAGRTLVEEVVNDTLLVVWRRAATYNQQSKVSTWIFAIAHRTALKARSRRDEPVDDADAEPAEAGDGPEQQHSTRQTRAALMRALDALSAEQRGALVLAYFHDLPYGEIARLGDLDNAFRHYSRALQLDPKHRGAHEYLGEAYLQAGDLPKAEQELKVLDALCFLPCESYSDLKAAIRRYKADHGATAAR